jgi:homeobox protein cut-like
MVTAQRDRFKKKNSELENELSKSYQTVSSLRSEIASLQKDNLSLYEKTRYVSTFNRHPSSAVSSGHQASSSRVMMPTFNESPSGLPMDRYRSTYEQNLSPFAAFRGRESARALKRMNLPERVVYQITRMVLATRTSRNLFAAYCVALHLLVLGMLYWIGAGDIERQASNLSESTVNPVAAGEVGPPDMEVVGDWVEDGFSGG